MSRNILRDGKKEKKNVKDEKKIPSKQHSA